MGLKKKISNPRWPHTCKLYVMEGVSAFSEGAETVLYEGACRVYPNDSVRSFNTTTDAGKVTNNDCAISIPVNGEGYIIDENSSPIGAQIGLDGIKAGCLVDYVSNNDERIGLQCGKCYPGTLGLIVYINDHKN